MISSKLSAGEGIVAGSSHIYSLNDSAGKLRFEGQVEISSRDVTPLPSSLDVSAANGISGFTAQPSIGFKFLDSLGRGPLGELWNVQTSDARASLPRIVFNP